MAGSKPGKGKAPKGAVPAKGAAPAAGAKGGKPAFPGAAMPFAKGGGRAKKAPKGGR